MRNHERVSALMLDRKGSTMQALQLDRPRAARVTRPGNQVRVLHVTQSAGGVERYLRTFVAASSRHRYSHSLAAPRYSSTYQTGGDVFDARWDLNVPRSIHPIRDVLAAAHLRRLLKRESFDILHLHSSKAGLIGRLAAGVDARLPIVFSPHGFSYLMYHGLARTAALLWEKAAAHLSEAHLLAVSPSEARLATLDVGFIQSRVRMIPCAVDVEGSQLADIPLPPANGSGDPAPTVLSVGRYLTVKNPLMVLEVAARVRSLVPGVQFVLATSGEHAGSARIRDAVLTRVKDLHLEGVVRLIEPWLDSRAMADEYARSTIYLSTSRAESFGLSVAESMLAGRAVVGTNVPGTRDLVVEGETGFLVPLDDADAAAERVIALLRQPALRRQLGSAGRARIIQHFDVRKRIVELEDFYQMLLATQLAIVPKMTIH